VFWEHRRWGIDDDDVDDVCVSTTIQVRTLVNRRYRRVAVGIHMPSRAGGLSQGPLGGRGQLKHPASDLGAEPKSS
jgi:hypothetical protein